MSRNFDGTGDYVQIADSSSLDVGQSMSVMCWIILDTYGGAGDNFISQIYSDEAVLPPESDALTMVFRIGRDGTDANKDKVTLVKNGGTNVAASSSVVLSLSVWTHLAVTTDSTNAYFYKNGVLSETIAFSTTPTQKTRSWRIGSTVSGTARDLDGRIAYFSFHNGVTLSSGEIAQCMRYPGSITRGLKLFMPMSGGSPEPDYSGNRNHGTVTGATVSSDNPPINGLYYPRVFGNEYAMTTPAGGGGWPFTNTARHVMLDRWRRVA